MALFFILCPNDHIEGFGDPSAGRRIPSDVWFCKCCVCLLRKAPTAKSSAPEMAAGNAISHVVSKLCPRKYTASFSDGRNLVRHKIKEDAIRDRSPKPATRRGKVVFILLPLQNIVIEPRAAFAGCTTARWVHPGYIARLDGLRPSRCVTRETTPGDDPPASAFRPPLSKRLNPLVRRTAGNACGTVGTDSVRRWNHTAKVRRSTNENDGSFPVAGTRSPKPFR